MYVICIWPTTTTTTAIKTGWIGDWRAWDTFTSVAGGQREIEELYEDRLACCQSFTLSVRALFDNECRIDKAMRQLPPGMPSWKRSRRITQKFWPRKNLGYLKSCAEHTQRDCDEADDEKHQETSRYGNYCVYGNCCCKIFASIKR